MNNVASYLKKIVTAFFIIISSICIGTTLLTLVYMIPTDSISKNVKESLYIFENEGTYHDLTNLCSSKLNNFTDGHFPLQAIYDGEESALDKAMHAYEVRYTDTSPDKSLLMLYGVLETELESHISSTTRYWHGNLVLTTPLLALLNWEQIRNLNLIIQTAINIILIITLYKRNLKAYICPYIISLLLIMPLTLAYNIANSFVFYIFSIGSIILINKNEKWKKSNTHFYLFLIMGILTSYFDYLTYPLVTFGMPFVFYLCMNGGKSIKDDLKSLFDYLVTWGIGYVGMWVGKWIIASIIYNDNTFKVAIGSIKVRTGISQGEMEYSYLDVISKNVTAFIRNPIIFIAIIYLLLIIFLVYRKHKLDYLVKNIAVYGVVAILPFVWYIGISNHSYVHWWMTYKILIITTFSIMCLFTKSLVYNKEDLEKNSNDSEPLYTKSK